MKVVRYLALGAIAMTLSMPAQAQDNKAEIDAITKVITANPTGCADQVKEVYKRNKKNPEVLVGIGNAYLQAKDLVNAEKYANLAIEKNKKYAPAYILLGDVAVAKDDGGAAASWYQQAQYFDPKNPQGYIKYAWIYRGRSPEEAVAKLEDLRAQMPEYPVDAEAAHIYYMSNKFSKAVERFDKVDRSKMDADQLGEYAFAALLNKDAKKSLEVSEYGLSRFPRSATLNRIAFYCNAEMENFPEAERYANALYNNSDSAKIGFLDNFNYGNVHMGNKNYDSAISSFEAALQENPDHTGAIKNLSDAYAAKKDYENALKHYANYLSKVDKKQATDVAALASLYEDAADGVGLTTAAGKDYLAKADATYEQLEKEFPTASVYANFRRAYLHLTKYDNGDVSKGGAAPYYQKLIDELAAKTDRTETDNTRLEKAYEYIGAYKLYTDQKDYKEYFEKVYELNPDNANAKQVLNK